MALRSVQEKLKTDVYDRQHARNCWDFVSYFSCMPLESMEKTGACLEAGMLVNCPSYPILRPHLLRSLVPLAISTARRSTSSRKVLLREI